MRANVSLNQRSCLVAQLLWRREKAGHVDKVDAGYAGALDLQDDDALCADPLQMGVFPSDDLLHFVTYVNGARRRRNNIWTFLNLVGIHIENSQRWGLGCVFISKANMNWHPGTHLVVSGKDWHHRQAF